MSMGVQGCKLLSAPEFAFRLDGEGVLVAKGMRTAFSLDGDASCVLGADSCMVGGWFSASED